MLAFINNFNAVIFILFTVMYLYQIVYVGVALFKKKKRDDKPHALHKYAVITSARNEEAVIGAFIQSVKQQNYPADMLDVFVVADNCTDNTAETARQAGAIVYERFNKRFVGKGYALDFIFKIIASAHSDAHYEGYFIFDADNLLDENYVAEMNKVFDDGYRIVTCYRNSKNYDTNWISAGYSLWFLREAKYLNNARMLLGTSCAVSGTGFLVASDVIRKNNGWKYHLLTEDIEFSIDSVIHGECIGYCGTAKIYDEQPKTFEESWNQRLRWSKGFYQVLGKYGGSLVHAMFRRDRRFLPSYDMFMTIAPAMLVSLASCLINALFLLYGAINIDVMPQLIPTTLSALVASFGNFYLLLFALGVLTTITEWKQINCSARKKVLYTFTFPLFIFTYVPISIAALFQKVEWKPIPHSIVKSIEEVR
nr:glycosyltransferase family 2 protein [Maliibacterium massiliense]